MAKDKDSEIYLDSDRSLSLGGCSFFSSLSWSLNVTKDIKKKDYF